MSQLALPLSLAPEAVFENYYPGTNSEAANRLQQPLGGGVIWLWGASGSGKSHLLQATCRQRADLSERVMYVSGPMLERYGPAILEGLGDLDSVAIDGIEGLVGNSAGETALFGLYNELVLRDGTLLIASRAGPQELSIELKDLSSRLVSGLVYKLQPLRGDDQLAAVIQRARVNGLSLNERVGEYLLSRIDRDMGSVCAWLDALDQASLAQRRRLTIPFIRETLGFSGSDDRDDGRQVEDDQQNE